MKKIRIGGGAGFEGDRVDAAVVILFLSALRSVRLVWLSRRC